MRHILLIGDYPPPLKGNPLYVAPANDFRSFLPTVIRSTNSQ